MHRQNLLSILSVLCTMTAAAPASDRSAGKTVSKRQATGWPSFCGPPPDASTTDITCVVPGTTTNDLDALLASLDPRFCRKTTTDGDIICTKDASGNPAKRDDGAPSTPWVLVPLAGGSAEKRDTPTIVLPPAPKTPVTTTPKDLKIPVPSDFVVDPAGKAKLLIPGDLAKPGDDVSLTVEGTLGPYKLKITTDKMVEDKIDLLDRVKVGPVKIPEMNTTPVRVVESTVRGGFRA